MKKTLIASLIGLAFAQPLFAADSNLELNDVVVTATRTAQPKEAVIADVTVIDREEIERAGVSSLTNLLSRQPGVQITTNGGAGTASSVFLRGTGTEQVVVLVDGLRINSATLGTTSFENIPLAQIERIEILRGPASSLYGADAVGGVIQIFTKKASKGESIVHAALGLGSYDTSSAEAGIHGSNQHIQYGINVSSFNTNSFSSINTRNNATKVKDADNDGYNNLSVSGHLDYSIVDGHAIGIQFFQSKGHNNSDGLGGNGNFDNVGNQTLQSFAVTSKNQIINNWHSTIKLGEGLDKSNSTSAFGRSTFKSTQTQLTWQNDFTLPVGHLTFAYDKLRQRVRSSTSYDKTARNNDSFLLNYFLNQGNHSVNASIREDHNSQFGNYTTGGLGYAYQITGQLKASASYGSAFRTPTFNQLYFPNFGNPDLSPEKSDNVEASLRYQGNHFNIGATLFKNKIRDLLANVGPAAGTCTFAGFCPTNTGKVEIEGVTLDGSWDITDHLLLSGNFTVQSPRAKEDQTGDINQLLVRRGNRYGTLNLLYSSGDLQWGAEVTGASKRYNDIQNTKSMSGYMLVNLTASYQLTPEWKLEGRANNLLDKDYILAFTGNTDTANPYSTAGSNFFVGLRYDMKP